MSYYPVKNMNLHLDTKTNSKWRLRRTIKMTAVFRREVAENCALLGCYAASSGYFVLFFSVLDSWTLRMGPICCPETSVRNYHYSLRNNKKSAVIKNTKKIYNTPKKYARLLRHAWEQFLLQNECRLKGENNYYKA